MINYNEIFLFSCCRQEEILEYLKSFARHFDLYKHIKFNQKVSIVEWNDNTQMWKIKTEQGHEYDANFVVSAPGPLHKPSIPKFKGISSFIINEYGITPILISTI